MKIFLSGMASRLNSSEERMSKYGGRSVEIIQNEMQRELKS